LDALPAESWEARASRRDLIIFNRVLGNEAWLQRVVSRVVRTGERVLELGAGDGLLARRMIRAGVAWDALDLAPAPAGWPREAHWFQVDARAFAPGPAHGVVAANLFFHHFDDATLAALGARLSATARVIAIADLRRARAHEWAFRIFARLVGAHAVSRHDGRLSIRAGFRRDELPRALGLEPAHWNCSITGNFLGAYRLLARRRA
jgi:hypothetical protein